MAKYKNITADTLVYTGKGVVYGFVVNSHTSGTLKLWDSTSAAFDVMLNTITFGSGPGFYEIPSGHGTEKGLEFETGLYADVGGTIDITICWSPRI